MLQASLWIGSLDGERGGPPLPVTKICRRCAPFLVQSSFIPPLLTKIDLVLNQDAIRQLAANGILCAWQWSGRQAPDEEV